MQPTINSLITITRKAAQFLQRDFLELEMLQKSSVDSADFCNKSYSRVKAILQEKLQKHSQFLFFPEDTFELDNIADVVLLINPLDSLSNLAKSLPFFALSITYLKKINKVLTPIYAVTHFPALEAIYYVEKGGGMWVEKNTHNVLSKNTRLRVSRCSRVENALIATNDLNNKVIFPQNTRNFGSYCYAIVLFAAGKLDVVDFTSLNYTLKPSFELIIQESGGLVVNNDKRFIATNYELAKQFKQ